MGWTHRAAVHMLNRFPQLGTNPELLEKWPALRLAVTNKETELGKSLSDALREGDIVTPQSEDVLRLRR